MKPDRSLLLSLAAALLAALPISAAPEDDALAESDRVDELERKVDLLTDELARTRQEMGVPEEKELESVWGLGPAASKVYGLSRGLSIGGYAEAFGTAIVHDKKDTSERNRFDALRAVLYAGYKFTDHIVFNSEIEFEHGTTSGTESSGGGSVSVEFAALDFLLRDELNVRGGLVLVPMGFINEMHEPPFFYGVNRPVVEQAIIPTTWRHGGVGLFGRIADMVEYKLYAVTSFNAAGFDDSGLRGGRQQGNRELAEDVAFVGRVDIEPIPALLVGGSVFVGETGQDQEVVNADDVLIDFPSARLVLWEVHSELNAMGFRGRVLFTMAHVDDAGELTLALRPSPVGSSEISATEAVASDMLGTYGEIGYDVMRWIAPDSGWTVEPFFRAEYIDTQHAMPRGFSEDKTNKLYIYTAGISAKPIPNVVVKLDYRNKSSRDGRLGDEVNLGFGLVF
jgi:opacity protein-like surface antigen